MESRMSGASQPVRFRRLLSFFLGVLLLTGCSAGEGGPEAASSLVIRGGSYFDVAAGEMVANSGLVIEGDRISEMGADLEDRDLSNATVISLDDDQYVLPGLFDLHAHHAVNLIGEGRVEEYSYQPLIFLANGVTSVWPGGSLDPEGEFALRERIEGGEQVGPRVFNSGPYFGRARPDWDDDASVEQIKEEVDYWAERGVKSFKAKSIGPVHLQALIEAARAHDIPVAGHLGSGQGNTVNARDAIRMGIARVEHILGGDILAPDAPAYDQYRNIEVDSPEFEDILALYLEHGVIHSPTMSITARATEEMPAWEYWVDERKFFTPFVRDFVERNPPFGYREVMNDLYWKKYETNRAFYEAGGHQVLSTDNPSEGTHLPGFNAHRELHTFVMAGIPPAGALKIGTINGARALNVSDELGSLEEGKLADAFIVEGNPLDDIRNTRNVQWVIKGGEVYDPARLLEQVEGKIGPTGPEDAHLWEAGGRPPVVLSP